MTQPLTDNFYLTTLLKRRWLSNKAFEIILERPSEFKFIPGQRIRLLRKEIERDYSIISAPADTHLALCIRKVKGGAMSSMLSSSKIGSHFKCSGPHGYFTFQSSQRPAIFVATGTGIAPFCSMIRAGITGFTLLHGVTKAEDLYYFSEFQSAAKIYVPCLSENAENVSDVFKGRVSDYLETILRPSAYDFYLCGRREMIRDVTLLVDERFPGSYIYTELFY